MLTAAMTSRSTRRVGSFGLLIPFRPVTRDLWPEAWQPGGCGGAVCDHRPVIPPILVIAGFVALATGWWLLRGLGPGARVARIISATPVVPVARAVELAGQGRLRYVGVFGRVDAAEPFEDDAHRPLVFRRVRLELRRGRRWAPFEEARQVVPFEIGDGPERIAVDGEMLDEGLVVVPRESVGTAADVADRVPAGTPPATPTRLRLDLLTAVEHALVLGVPTLDSERGPILRPGLGRPLVLTDLEVPEAMRLLADGRRGTTRAISLLLGGGTALVLAGVSWAVVDALG